LLAAAGSPNIVSRTDLRRPIGSKNGQRSTRVENPALAYRLLDFRHTFVSRLAENPAVSEETIRALAGHVSQTDAPTIQSHTDHAKEAAILGLENAEIEDSAREATGDRTRNWAQSQQIDCAESKKP